MDSFGGKVVHHQPGHHFLQSPANSTDHDHNGGGIHFQPRDRDSTRCQSAQPMVGQQKSPQVMERRRCTGHCTRQIRRGRVPQTSHLPTIPFKLVRTTPTQHDHASLPGVPLPLCSIVQASVMVHTMLFHKKTTTPRNPTTHHLATLFYFFRLKFKYQPFSIL